MSNTQLLPSLAAFVSVQLLVRLLVGVHPYSGLQKPPLHGDYEAQRHWMEITVNTPVSDWYRSTPDNDLQYWGLDYPPLSAYQSWLYGKGIQRHEPAAVALHASRGYETPFSKRYMRRTALLSELCFFLPGVLAFVLASHQGGIARVPWRVWVATLANPALLLIDHGHFQYNSISLGLAAGAAAAVAKEWDVLGSVLFCLSLNHKQMSMYFAPAFFAYLLGKSLRRPCLLQKTLHVGKLGVTVLGTFAVVWAPFLTSTDSALAVLQRLAPIKRGLFEDYVANFWCASSLVVKWRRLFEASALVKLCALLTLAGCLPSVVMQIRRPSRRGLVLCMANTALAFFLFSYQVHEKSILLPLLPITLLAGDYALFVTGFSSMAAFSMFPLLKKDGLTLAYFAVQLLYLASMALAKYADRGVSKQATGGPRPAEHRDSRWDAVAERTAWCSAGVALVIHACHALLSPPSRYPYLFDALLVTYAFTHFAAAFMFLHILQWRVYEASKRRKDA